MKSRLLTKASLLILAATCSQAATTIYSDTFTPEGAETAATALNGTTTTTGGGTWSSSSGATVGGTVAARGASIVSLAAALPGGLATDTIYTLTGSITYGSGMATNGFIGIGLSSATVVSTPASAQAADRFNGASVPGYAWGFIGGLGTASAFGGSLATNAKSLTSDAYAINGTVGSTHILQMIYDTSGDGSSFTMDFLIDGVSRLVGGPTTVNTSLSTIKSVGFTDNATPGASKMNSISFTSSPVPEPGSALLCSVGLLALLRRRR